MSRARRCIENVFGIMACKWRILLRPIETQDKNADYILQSIVGLHNFLIQFSPADRHPSLMADQGIGNEDNGRWRQEIIPLQSIRAKGGARNYSESASRIRDRLTNFVNTVGRVNWQENYLWRCKLIFYFLCIQLIFTLFTINFSAKHLFLFKNCNKNFLLLNLTIENRVIKMKYYYDFVQ